MIIKLTHKGKPTLVNVNNILSIYMDTDMKQQKLRAKVTMSSGVVFVDESLEEIYDIINDVMSGNQQVIDWTNQPQPIDERVESDYNQVRNTYRPTRRPYNPHYVNDLNY
jgi:predicted transcriptional regulator